MTWVVLTVGSNAAGAGWTGPAKATLIAGVLAGAVALISLGVNAWARESARRRKVYAAALGPVHAYQEFPYAIRRRRCEAEHRSAERTRLEEQLRDVQRELTHHVALLRIEGRPDIVRAYLGLVQKTREVAGGSMKDAWASDPIESDEQMNIKIPLDYSALKKYEEDYVEAVRRARKLTRCA